MNVLLFFNGVLRNNSGSPIVQGVALYRSLQTHRRTVILSDSREKTEKWLRDNKILNIDDLVCTEEAGIEDELRLVEHCRSKGPIDTVVTDNPELASQLLEQGITTLLFISPKYIRPEFRPDAPKGIKAWADLQSELDRQDDLYREDPRANEDHLFGR